jgi:hypothetical protein
VDYLNLIQWPAMVVTISASWLIASTQAGRRAAGFWIFLLSNVMWTVWGWHTGAWALVALQIALAATNIRGAKKTEDVKADASEK